jgi:hypothetical protein
VALDVAPVDVIRTHSDLLARVPAARAGCEKVLLSIDRTKKHPLVIAPL